MTRNKPPEQEDRQSKIIRKKKFRPLTSAEKAEREAANTLLQYDRMVQLIREAISSPQRFRLRSSVIQELNRISIAELEEDAGRWRDAPIKIGKSSHVPPPWQDVPRLVDEMCEYVNDNWQTESPFHLAAYVMWRLNWVHPFVDGNGRTTRAVSYYVLCAKLQFHIPGVQTVPEMVAQNKSPYYRALEAADAAYKTGRVDVSEMHELLQKLLARQMVLALGLRNGNGLRTMAKSVESPQFPSPLPESESRATKALRSPTVFMVGAVFGGITLLFFMALILLAIFGRTVPENAKYLVIIVLALFGGLSAGFVGGNASARGRLPLPFAQDYPLAIALTGGIAVLVILLILGRYLFL